MVIEQRKIRKKLLIAKREKKHLEGIPQFVPNPKPVVKPDS